MLRRTPQGTAREGVAAIMDDDFRPEERQLLTVLRTLHLHDDVGRTLGRL
jgi:hypothetical protein